MDTSTGPPRPVVPRRTRAARTPENAYMAAAMSAAGTPAFTGSVSYTHL